VSSKVEELTCRYYLGANKLVLLCTSPSGYRVVDKIIVNEDDTYLRWTYIGKEASDWSREDFDGMVKSEEFKGVLKIRSVEGLSVLDAVVNGVRVVKVSKEGAGEVVVRGHDPVQLGEAVAKELIRLSVPVERVIDAATEIADPNNAERLKHSIRERLTSLDTLWPILPIRMDIVFSPEVESYKREILGAFDVYKMRDGTLLVRVPAACRRNIIALSGGGTGVLLMCTANRLSKEPRIDVVTERSGVYLTSSAIHFSAYIEEKDGVRELLCLERDDKCVKAAEDAVDERGIMVLNRDVFVTQLGIAEAAEYTLYSIKYGDRFFYFDRGDISFSFSERDFEKLEKALSGANAALRKAILAALQHTKHLSIFLE